MASSHPELVVTKYLDGQPSRLALCCSVCGKAIRQAHDRIYVSSSELLEEFRKHCKQEHRESN
jgi:hypothetical protein